MTFLTIAHTVHGAHPEFYSYLYSQCTACGKPIAVEVTNGQYAGQVDVNLVRSTQSLSVLGWRITKIWPHYPTPTTPLYLPDQVDRAYTAAERNYPLTGMEEASAASYGRALDIGTKLFASDLAAENLYNRIRKLADQNRVTDDLARWAHEIRLIRNDALHDIDSIDREELTAIRGFAEMVLTYLFTLPGMLAARKAAAGGTAPMT